MRKLISFLLLATLLPGLIAPALAAVNTELDAAVNRTAAYMLEAVKNPIVDSVGGEWAVIGLARSGFNVPDAYFENYLRNVESTLRANNGVLHNRRLTDYSRVILALTASGFDPRNAAGFDLTLPLGNFDRVVAQGINGPIWALIALDSGSFPIPNNPNAVTQSTREMFVAEILRRQTHDGGWNLSAGANGPVSANETGDADLTGMALQALSNYQDDANVRAATQRALVFLSSIQDNNGGFTGTMSVNSSAVESAVQVLVALTSLGISLDDPRFVKNGNTVLDNIMSYALPDGSFTHTRDGRGNNQMSTEQAFYGLVAAQRAEQGKNRLYDMSDAPQRGSRPAAPPAAPESSNPGASNPGTTSSGTSAPGTAHGLPGRNPAVSVTAITSPGRSFEDISGHASKAAIEALAARGIIGGMTETTFAPDQTMTRAQFAAIIARALALPEKNENPFEDVSGSAWFHDAVSAAFYYGIIAGNSPDTFNPGGTITTQEAAVMVARAAALTGMDTEVSEIEVRNKMSMFGDFRSVSSWAQASLAFCFNAGILDDSEFYIRPLNAITRAEIAEMIFRMLDSASLL